MIRVDLNGTGGFHEHNPDNKPGTLRDALDGVRRELDPGEVILAGCDARVTAKVGFLQHPRAERSPYVSHFLTVTDRRVLVFSISPKAFAQGLAGPAVLRYQAPRDGVCVAQFKQKALTGRLRLQFAAGMVPFEVNRQTREILAEIAGLLPSCGPVPDRGQPDSFVRGLAPFGNAAVPAAEFYFAAEDQLAAAGELTVVSKDILNRLQLTSKVSRTVPAVAAFMLGYAARLSVEAAGAEPVVNRGDLPPLEYGIAGPKPSSVQDHSKDIMRFAAGLAGRIAELIPVPEPVWQGFERAVTVKLAEKYGRAGRRAAAEARQMVMTGYLARIIDQGYGLAPAVTASRRPPTP